MIERCCPSLETLPRGFSTIERGRAQMVPARGPRQALHRPRARRRLLPNQPAPLERRYARAAFRSPAQRLYTADQLQGLGFSLKPPKKLRKFIKKHKTALLIGAGILTAGLLAPGAVAAVAGTALKAGGIAGRFIGRTAGGAEKLLASRFRKMIPRGGPRPSDSPYPSPTPPPSPSPSDTGGGGDTGGGVTSPTPSSPFPSGGGGGAPSGGGDVPNSSAVPAETAKPAGPSLGLILAGALLVGVVVTNKKKRAA